MSARSAVSPAASAEVAEAMADPSFYPSRPATVERRETHTSTVYLAGDLVYKIKKPVRFEFLDYSTLALRRQMCQEEVRLNRRLASDVYLGVRAIANVDGALALAAADAPRAVEYAVEMRRFDEAGTLAARLASDGVGAEQIRAIAGRIADFHTSAEVVGREEDPRIAIRRASGETFASLFELLPPSLEAEVVAAQRFTDAFLLRERETIVGRARAGLVRDGHGDLRADHVVLEDPIEIVDCIEFDAALRRIDVAADLAFLVMDLHRLGAADRADNLVHAYRACGGDPGDDALIAFHAAQRAWVRSKVELLRARQLDAAGDDSTPARDTASQLLTLGRRFAWQARQPLLLIVCGLSGSGKTHFSEALSALTGFKALSSDPVRKRLAGLEPMERGQGQHYTPEFNSRTYAELGHLASAELRRRGAVIVDATFRCADERRAFTEAAGERAANARFVECLTPRALRLRRVERRATAPSVSDATAAVAGSQSFEELSDVAAARHLTLRTDRTAAACISELECWLDSAP